MKRFLSVLLALMMVVSTVSFAAPAVVTVADSATDASVAYEATETTTDEVAELSADSEYGTLVFNIDFEKDGISFTKDTAVDVNTITDNYNADICPANITFTPKSFVDNPTLVTDANGNTYLNCTNSTAAAGYRFFQITESSNTFNWTDGTFTMVVDYYYTGGLHSIAFHVNGGNAAPTMIEPIKYTHSTWQTVIGQYSGQLQNFYIAPGYAENYTNNFGVDNIKLYYSAETANVTIKADNATTATADGVVAVNRTTGMTVADIVANSGMTDLISIAETKDGAMLSTDTVITPVYAKSYYGVFGFDVTVLANGNSEVSDVTLEDIDTRVAVTVGDAIDYFNEKNDVTTKVLRGVATTPDGEPLDRSTVINTTQILYAIWEADESEYGTLLANIDFENYTAGTDLSTNYLTVENFDPDALTNGEFTVIWEVGADTITEDSDGNKYIRGGQQYAQIRLIGNKYDASVSPMPNGTYTFVLDAANFGSSARTINATTQGSGVAPTLVDSFVGTPNVWDKVVAQWNGTTYDMTLNFADSAATDVGFDNVKLFYTPAADATYYITISANGKANTSDTGVSVAAGASKTAGELKALMPGCIGIAETANGAILPDNAIILPKYNKTVYAVWGFDVTLNAGFNTEMSNVVVSGIDTRFGTTIGDLISEINNTTDRTLLGLATSADGVVLDKSTAVKSASTYYMIWEVDESEYGTLVFNIDFEKYGISAPGTSDYVDINDITDIYNKDLVPDRVYFGSRFGTVNELVTSGDNTYLVSTGSGGGSYINLYIKEASDSIDWLNGTYTAMVDAMVLDTKAEAVTSHVNDLQTGITATSLDSFSNVIGEWDTVTYTFTGKLSYDATRCHYYIAFKMPEGKQIAFDNYKLYFKTDETVITLKANGNSDISDIEVPVSTSTGITVAELIAEANKYETTHTLLGISNVGTGEPMDEATLIKPLYQQSYYLIWSTSENDETISTKYGKLLFDVDFERDSILESGWDGQLSLDATQYTVGSHPVDVASYYDEVFEGENFRIKFLTTNASTNASIKKDASGNNYLSGTAESQYPQITISNNNQLKFGAGYYTVFFDGYCDSNAGALMRVSTPSEGYTIFEGVHSTIPTYFAVPDGEWMSYGFSFELSEDAVFPNMTINYTLDTSDMGEATVGWDDFKVYFKPYEATVTILPGDYEEFGETTITGVDTTTATTLEAVISSLESDFAVCGREFVGLMDKYGETVVLTESVIIPCDMTYTIVWGEMNEYAPVTWEKNSIRYSTKVNSRGIRFAADTNPTYALDPNTTEYGWVIARTDVLEKAGIRATSLTKESFGGDPKKIIVGKNYGYQSTDDDDADRKHFDQDDDNIVITAVIYGVPENYYGYAFTVRPYMVVDGVHFYGKPWSRSIYDTAVAMKEAGYPNCDEDLINYIDTIIANTPAAN